MDTLKLYHVETMYLFDWESMGESFIAAYNPTEAERKAKAALVAEGEDLNEFTFYVTKVEVDGYDIILKERK